jgi:opacity protein-like surface antigen
MIKYILVGILLVSNSISAQIKFGAKAGLNMTDASQGANFKGNIETENVTVITGNGSTISNSEITTKAIDQTFYVNTSPKASFYIGGFVELPINKKGNLALKTEFIYCQNGATLDKKTPTGNEDIYYSTEGGSYSIGQLNVPILVKFTTARKIAFHAGGYFGTILFANATNNNGNITTDQKSKLKTFDLGVNLGASYPINKNLSIEIRYNRGLLNIDKTIATDGVLTAQGLYYSRTFHVGLEYLL